MRFAVPLSDPSQTNLSIFYDFSHMIFGDGNQKNALLDAQDIGRYTALIIADPRTLNKYVFCYAEEKSQNEIWDVAQKKIGKEIDTVRVSSRVILYLGDSD